MEIRISQHAYDRAKSRLNLKGERVIKEAQNAYTKGKVITDFSKSGQKYLFNVLAHSSGDTIRIWRNAIFIFGQSTLITTYTLSNNFIKQENRERGKRI